MNARLRTAARIANRIVSLLFGVLLLLFAATTLAAYLAATGKSLPLLRTVTARLGQLVAGQRTEQVSLDVRVVPDQGRLIGSATLHVRALEDKRQHFYFLLNDGLRVRSVSVRGVDSASRPPSAYQFWLLTVVDVGTPVAKDAMIELTFDYDGQPATRLFGVAANTVNPRTVLLNVDSFWYPSDVQGFFSADVTVTVPTRMTLICNGRQQPPTARGEVQQFHWVSQRPIAGLSLVAGAYGVTTHEANGVTYRLYLPDDMPLDAQRILHLMADADRSLTDRYASSGFNPVTLFVSTDVHRAFNDGSGLLGLAPRYFRAGDYGFATIAHEMAHNWWGGTVAEKWLAPGTGGEWIVEGFAEFSSLLAAESEYGPDALTERLVGEFFDPAAHGVVENMSVLDNALAESVARDTIYRKGAYVASMLRRVLGDEAYFRGLRQFIERFKYQQATDRDLQQVLEETSGQKLDPYFADWVRSDHLADLSLDATKQGEVTVNNLGTATIGGDIDLWTFKKGGGEPIRTTVHVGDQLPWQADADYAVLDPQLAWADMQRENNRYPRRRDPIYVAASQHEALALADGEVFPWVRSAVSSLSNSGEKEHTWEFTRGLAAPPAWSQNGSQLIVSYADGEDMVPAIVTLAADGTRRTIGRGTMPAAASSGVIYAGKRDRILRIATDGSASTAVRRPGSMLDHPLPAPDGGRFVYTAARGNHLDLRIARSDGQDDRLLSVWDRDRLLYRWSHDGARLYAAVGGSWDWQIWEIPADGGPLRVLASAAAAIGDLAVSPDDSHLAFTAAPSLDYPHNRRQLYVMNPTDRTVRTIDVADADLTQVAWIDPDSLLVVAREGALSQPFMLPATRTVKRIRLTDGSIEDFR